MRKRRLTSRRGVPFSRDVCGREGMGHEAELHFKNSWNQLCRLRSEFNKDGPMYANPLEIRHIGDPYILK